MNVDEINVFFDIPNNTANILLDDILKNNYDKNKIIISDNVYTDTNIDEWIKTKPSTMGGIKLIDKLIKTPINDKKILLNRQKANYIIPKYQLEILKNCGLYFENYKSSLISTVTNFPLEILFL